MNSASATAQKQNPLRSTFRSLAHRNYRLFFGGQGLSLIGTWMTRVATSWLIYQLTGKDWWLGIISFAGQIPILLLAPMAGVWAERSDRQRLLVATQALAMVQSFALAALALAGWIEVWEIVVLAVFQGIINAIDTPARQAFLIEIIEDRRFLSNAIALNSSMFNGARLVGPAIAGALYAAASSGGHFLTGAGVCFLIDGISYLFVIAALLAMRVNRRPPREDRGSAWHDLREGLRYSFHMPAIRVILLVLGVVSLFGVSIMVLMPAFAKEVLNGNAQTYGFLMAASGLGALCGALYLASRASVVGLSRVIPWSCGAFGISSIVFAYSTWIWLSLVASFTAGFGLMILMAAANSILQTIVEDDKRARVMGLYTMTVLGMTPLGSLLSAGLVAKIGPPATVAMGGVVTLLAALYYMSQRATLRRVIRPIYEKAGLLPPVVAAVQTATDVGEAA